MNATVEPSAYRQCRLCPRNCGVDREAGEVGFCGETAVCRVASATAHFGEEPPFSGSRGSGTIFFSGCSCGCFFCQNYRISREHAGQDVSDAELLGLARDLAERGVHNINFVTPDHFLPHIATLCTSLRADGVAIPFLWNSSGYTTVDTADRAAGFIDVFMPDFKFADPDLARRCMGDADYPRIALESLSRMVERAGFLHPFDETGNRPARTGVLVRHLVLPGHADNSIRVLELLAREFGRQLPLSVMSQFRPVPECARRGELTRSLHSDEYARVCERVEDLGFENVFVQPDFGDEAFLPDFDEDEPFEGNRRHAPAES